MTINVSTTNRVRSDVPAVSPGVRGARSHGRGWALAGVGAGLAGLATIVASGMVDAVYDEKLGGDPQRIQAELAQQTGQMLAFHVSGLLTAVLMAVFAAGLFRRLRAGAGADSVAPLLAFGGLLGTAVVLVLGTGLDTEFVLDMGNPRIIDASNAAMFNHWVGTIAWCWVLAGLAGLAAHAVSRTGGLPRWIGRVGLVLGGITVVAGVSPLQYVAGMTGALWLLVTALGLTVGDRAHRAGR